MDIKEAKEFLLAKKNVVDEYEFKCLCKKVRSAVGDTDGSDFHRWTLEQRGFTEEQISNCHGFYRDSPELDDLLTS